MTAGGYQPNRCRLLTPARAGAIAVIRVSGPRAVEVVGELFRPPEGRRGVLATNRPRRLHYGQIIVEGQPIDEVLVSARMTPEGVPAVDISAHGGVRVVERILMALQARGFEIEAAGSTGEPAWPTRHSLDEEVVTALGKAQTRRVVDFLLQQRRVLPDHVDQLAGLAVHNPAAACDALRSLRDGAPAGLFLVEGATVALIGPPNAGKSTLANRLFGAPRVIVSETPGTTRDWVAEPTAIRGIPVTVLDTPGIADTSEPLEALAVRRAGVRWAQADLQLVVLDGSDELPARFFERIRAGLRDDRRLIVVSKSDLPRRWNDTRLPSEWRSLTLPVSARGGAGLAALEERIVAALGLAEHQDQAPRLFTRGQLDRVSTLLEAPQLPGEVQGRRIRRVLIEDR